MATFNLTAEKFEETVTADGITFIDFWAEWCGPCKSFGPIYETASEQDLAGGLRIQSIPTIMAFRDGILLFSQPGALPAASFDELIAAIRAVDMDDVRRQIAEAEATE